MDQEIQKWKEKIPSHWEKKLLGDVCTFSKGKKPPKLNSSRNNNFSIPYINIKAFEKGIYEEFTDGDKCNLCNDNDLLMVWDGARCGLMGKAKKGAVGSTLMKIIPNKNVNNEYLYYFIVSKFHTLNTKSKGVGIPHIEPTLIWNFEFLLPPLAEQETIVAKIEELFSEMEKGKEQLETALAQLKVYRQSLLQAAFSGMLTNPDVKEGELPEGWKKLQIKDVGKVQLGRQRSPKNVSKNYPTKYIRAANIDNNGLNLIDILEMEFSPKEFEVYKLEFGDIVLSEASGSASQVGKPAIWRNEIKNCCFQNTIIRLRANNEIANYNFLFMLFKNFYQSGFFAKISGGVGINHLSAGKFSTIEIPLPSLSVQEEIVQILESKLTVCDKIEETIKQSLAQAEVLRQSILKQAFEGKLVGG